MQLKKVELYFNFIFVHLKSLTYFHPTVSLGAAIIPGSKSPQFFIDLYKKDPNGLEEFLSLPIVQDKIIALEKSAADLKLEMSERTIK